ncbi:amine oxidase, partial [Acinetobacter baumannii]
EVRRATTGAFVRVEGEDAVRFDQVVLAVHSDQALRLLPDASPEEQALLGDIRYAPNRIVLHSDAGLMPRRKAAWCSWNYVGRRS